jgi:hypothetical protein
MSDIDDRIDLGNALRITDKTKPRPYACCPRDGEPLITSLERRGAEFVCLVCGGWFGFLSPKPGDPTPELDARYAELKARYDAGERP